MYKAVVARINATSKSGLDNLSSVSDENSVCSESSRCELSLEGPKLLNIPLEGPS
jgi:hypothetical protein